MPTGGPIRRETAVVTNLPRGPDGRNVRPFAWTVVQLMIMNWACVALNPKVNKLWILLTTEQSEVVLFFRSVPWKKRGCVATPTPWGEAPTSWVTERPLVCCELTLGLSVFTHGIASNVNRNGWNLVGSELWHSWTAWGCWLCNLLQGGSAIKRWKWKYGCFGQFWVL